MSRLFHPLGKVRSVISQGPHTPTNAVDLDAADDSLVYASHSGRLTKRVSHDGGNVVEIVAPDLFTQYFHLQGDEWWRLPERPVVAGQRIATMGATGTPPWGGSYGPHLHFASRVNGVWTYPPTLGFYTEEVSELVIGRTPDGKPIVRVSDYTQRLTEGTAILDAPSGKPRTRMPRDADVEFYGLSEDGRWAQVEVGSPHVSPFPIMGWVEAGTVTKKAEAPDAGKRLAVKDKAMKAARAELTAGIAA